MGAGVRDGHDRASRLVVEVNRKRACSSRLRMVRRVVVSLAVAPLFGCVTPAADVRPTLPMQSVPVVAVTQTETAVPESPVDTSPAEPTPMGPPEPELPTQTWRSPSEVALDERGEELANRAASLVGVKSLDELHVAMADDCVGFVRLVYESLGIDLLAVSAGPPGENGVRAIWRRAQKAHALHKKPKPGDLVFFHETYDRNHDGRRDDGLTHIGIVESVDDDGTVTFVHRGTSGIHRSRMNTRHPKARYARGGEVLNDILRAPSKQLRAYTTGELFSGYADTDRL